MTADIINCLVVDDEPYARKVVMEFCSHIPRLRVLAECGNALEARNVMQQQPADILFLDIHMPVLDGMAFLKTLEKKPQIIFTTAYKEYAANAFDLAACDYLVKPFSLERFIIAVDRALEKIKPASANEMKTPAAQSQTVAASGHFFIKAEGKIYNLYYNEILFAEAKGNYTRIVTSSTVVTPFMSFKAFEELLPADLFFRVHRSFIVNKSKITHIEGNMVYIGQNGIPVGSNFKEGFLKMLGL